MNTSFVDRTVTEPRPSWVRRHPLLAYLALAFGITWLGSLIYFLSTPSAGKILPGLVAFPASTLWYFGPCLAGLIIARYLQTKNIRPYRVRFKHWRFRWRLYAFIFLYPALLHLAVVALDWLLTGAEPRFFQAEGVPDGNPALIILVLILVNFFQRGIGEEGGWRGLALPLLQERNGPALGSLYLGLIWGLWHFHPANFPVLFAPQALQSGAPLFIFLNILATTFIFTWVYNHTDGSLLAAGLFHTWLNVIEYIIPTGLTGATLTNRLFQLGLIGIFVLALLVLDRNLGKEPAHEYFPGTARRPGLPGPGRAGN